MHGFHLWMADLFLKFGCTFISDWAFLIIKKSIVICPFNFTSIFNSHLLDVNEGLHPTMKTKQPRKIDQYWHNSGPCGLITRTALRTLQFTLAIITAGLYGADLSHSTKTSNHAGSEWIYAEVVAALSAITCIVHCFATVTRVGWCTWDFVLFVLWMAQTGVFGNIYVRKDVQRDYMHATGSLGRMRAGVWVGLVCMVLWLGTFVLAVGWCCRTRKVVRRTDQETANKTEENATKLGDEEGGYKVVDGETETEIDESDRDSIKKTDKGEKGAKMSN